MSWVLDRSAALAWCFADESTPVIDALMLQVARDGVLVPGIWRLRLRTVCKRACAAAD